ncbi:N-acetylglucosamine repressor [Devosia sp. UYZn731]|uniref:ROK family transcriptional regulator n=1 Tax=Devosia sp. UYZn731 TaxID=3156345 RepID=UPI00339B9761
MADQTLVRFVNERNILASLRVSGPTTRADLARLLSLTPASITRVVNDLVSRDLIVQMALPKAHQTAREPGRPGVGVGLNAGGAYFLGVEVGVGLLRFAVIDLAAGVAQTSQVEFDPASSPSAVVELIAAKVEQLQTAPTIHAKLRGVGVTVPGLVDLDGHVVNLPILGWRNIGFGVLLEDRLSLPVSVENNANAAALGAVYADPEMSAGSAIFLKLGTGCGGAAIINGQLLRGAFGTAGELGHIRVSDDGYPCSCGQLGCLESWVNLSALARAFGAGNTLGAAKLQRLPRTVAASFRNGEERGKHAVESIAKYLGLGISSLVNVFNPNTVVLSGIMRPVLEICLKNIQSDVARRVIFGSRIPEIRLSGLADSECAIGAATVAYQRFFEMSPVEN